MFTYILTSRTPPPPTFSPSLVSPMWMLCTMFTYFMWTLSTIFTYFMWTLSTMFTYFMWTLSTMFTYFLWTLSTMFTYFLWMLSTMFTYFLWMLSTLFTYFLWTLSTMFTHSAPCPLRTAPPVSLATRLHPAALFTAGQITLSFRVPQAGKRDYDKPPKAFGGGNCILLWLEIELSAVILYDVYDGEVKLLETCVGVSTGGR